jgi:hypothetical protein
LLSSASGVKPKSIITFLVSPPRCDSTCNDRPNSLMIALCGGWSLSAKPYRWISTLPAFAFGATASW